MSYNSKVKIALVGPTHPYVGGISQYTDYLREALEKKADLTTISFRRQYPKFLYPGNGPVALNKQSDSVKGVNYLLDIYSPLSLRTATQQIIESGCELAILEWWTLIWQPGIAYMARRLRKNGVKVAFLCHNLFDHEASGLKRGIAEKLLSQTDAYIIHSKEDVGILKQQYPKARVLQRIHPINQNYEKPINRLQKRGNLEVLFYGYIRPYKGLDLLIEAMSKLNDPQIHLTIAGEVWGDKKALEEKLNKANIPSLEVHLEYIDDQETSLLFDRSDVVALPYISATGSGVVALAYNYGKPVIATKVGGLADAVLDKKTGWLIKPNSPDALAECLKKINRSDTEAMKSAVSKFSKENSWDGMAELIIKLAEELNENKNG